MRQFLNQYITVLLWEPQHGRCSRECPATIFIAQLHEESNTSHTRQELLSLMANRQEWDRLIKLVRVHLKYMKNGVINTAVECPCHFIVTKRGTCNIHIVTGKGHKKTKQCLLSKSKQEALYLNFEELPKANPESYHFLSCTHNEASTPNQDITKANWDTIHPHVKCT